MMEEWFVKCLPVAINSPPLLNNFESRLEEMKYYKTTLSNNHLKRNLDLGAQKSIN